MKRTDLLVELYLLVHERFQVGKKIVDLLLLKVVDLGEHSMLEDSVAMQSTVEISSRRWTTLLNASNKVRGALHANSRKAGRMQAEHSLAGWSVWLENTRGDRCIPEGVR